MQNNNLNEKIKLIRRDSLRLECEGVFDELEKEEDGEYDNGIVTHSECMMLQRVLADRARLPRVCAPAAARSGLRPLRATHGVTMQPASSYSGGGGGSGGGVLKAELARRLSGGVPGAFAPDGSSAHGLATAKKELGGPIALSECQSLAAFLRPSVGGAYLLPNACTTMLKREEAGDKKEEASSSSEAVYARIKRRVTQIATEVKFEEWPPTFV